MATVTDSITGYRFIYDNRGELVAVHGRFCSGCSATRGNCGKLTAEYVAEDRD